MKAFPTATLIHDEVIHTGGMDLRDYFAAMAMQAYLTGDYDLYPHKIPQKAYEMADAMMKARNETP
jgi:hypothetical protein